MKRLVAVLALMFGSALAAYPASSALSTAQSVCALSHVDAAHGQPTDFTATVTYFRIFEKTLFVQDGDCAFYVHAWTDLTLVPGDHVRIKGTTQDSFRPIVVSHDISLLQHGSPPIPVVATYATLIRSMLDARYVTVHGMVRSANLALTSGKSVTELELGADGGTIDVTLDSSDPSRLQHLLDAEVDITGVASGRFDGKMQQTGLLLHVNSWDQIKIARRSSQDAWSIPVTPMDEVLRDYNVLDRTPRVRVRGILTYYHPANMAVLQDGSKSIRVRTSGINPLHMGARVEAIGFPFVENGFLNLRLGEIHEIGSAAPIQPQPLHWNDLASGKFAFDLVSIDGTVVTQVREHAQDTYIISTEGNLFSATVRHPFVYGWNTNTDPPPMPQIRPGSKVRVTGVAILDEGNPFNGAIAFGVLLRSASDVAVIKPAPWMNVQNLMLIISALLLTVILVGLWAAMMKRRVHRQSAALARRIEAEAILERRRSHILEDINGRRPLHEILEQIAALVSFHLDGAPCWIQTANNAPIGDCPPNAKALNVLRQEIRSQSGPLHGTLYAALDPQNRPAVNTSDALSMGAWLATLAIETRGLYSDLVHRSEFDLLTDIHNRFSLEKRLDTLLNDTDAGKHTFGLIYIDLDEFKQVNDRFGHRIGDLYLQAVAQRMKHQLRPGDLLARLGGDEFAALALAVRSRQDVAEIAARMERCFDEPFSLDGCTLRGAASVGYAVFPQDGITKDALLSAADAFMYETKHLRRDTKRERTAM